MTEVVSHWGVHNASGIWFLEQTEGASNALGLSLDSPFTVRPIRKCGCNHTIKLIGPTGAREIQHTGICNDPLIQEMAPRPKPGVAVTYFVDNGRIIPAVSLLARLTSPVSGFIKPFWARKPSEWLPELETTNIQPLVLTGIEPRHTPYVQRLVSASTPLPRRLVLVGQIIASMPLVNRVTFSPPEYPDLPWEEVGGWLLGRWMRGKDVT